VDGIRIAGVNNTQGIRPSVHGTCMPYVTHACTRLPFTCTVHQLHVLCGMPSVELPRATPHDCCYILQFTVLL
jgi:hypothetical protein